MLKNIPQKLLKTLKTDKTSVKYAIYRFKYSPRPIPLLAPFLFKYAIIHFTSSKKVNISIFSEYILGLKTFV